MLKSTNNFKAKKIFEDIRNLPLAMKASAYKTFGRIAYADCFTIATALEVKGIIVTGDREFRQFEKDVKVLWLRSSQ